MAPYFGPSRTSMTKPESNPYLTARPTLEDWQARVDATSDPMDMGRLWNEAHVHRSFARDPHVGYGQDYLAAVRNTPAFQEYARRLREANKGKGGLLHRALGGFKDLVAGLPEYVTDYQKREQLIKAAAFMAAAAGAAGAGGGATGFFTPAGTWVPGTATGSFGTIGAGGSWAPLAAVAGGSTAAPTAAGGVAGVLGPAGATTSGIGGMSWQELALHGIPVLTNYLGARDAAGQAQKFQDAQRHQRNETLGFASPDAYIENYNRYLDEFKNAYRPWLVGEQDRAAIGEQTALQGFEADLARRGLSGSGLALAGRSAIRTGRQAQIGENMRRYWTQTEEAARDAAGQTRSAQISASLGAPYSYVPRPSPTTAAVQGLGDSYRDWLWLQSTENNPFVSKKDASWYR